MAQPSPHCTLPQILKVERDILDEEDTGTGPQAKTAAIDGGVLTEISLNAAKDER